MKCDVFRDGSGNSRVRSMITDRLCADMFVCFYREWGESGLYAVHACMMYVCVRCYDWTYEWKAECVG